MGETRPPRPPDRPSLAANYRTLYSSGTFVGFALVMGLMFGGQLLFISTSSFVLIDRLGLEPRVFGISFGLVALGLMGGAMISSRLVRHILPRRVVLLGVSIAVTSTGTMAVLGWSGFEHPLVVLLPMLGSALGVGMSRPSAMAGALVPFPQFAGLASSMLVFSQMTLSTVYNIAYSQAFAPGVVALGTGMFAASTTALLAVLILRPGSAVEHGDPRASASLRRVLLRRAERAN